MNVLPGQERKLIESFEKWEKERKSKVPGVAASYLLRSDKNPGEFFGAAVFADKASYQANAEDPEQDIWYRQVRRLLESDPEWNDGEYVFGKTA